MSLNSFRSKATRDFLKRFFAAYLVVSLLLLTFSVRPNVVLAEDGSSTPSDQNPPADQGSSGTSGSTNPVPSDSSSTVTTGDATAAADVQNQANTTVVTTDGSTNTSSTQAGSGDQASTTPDGTASTTPSDNGDATSTTPDETGTTTPADNGTASTTIQGDNTASTTNDVNVAASTGGNSVSNNGGNATIETGTGVAVANVINVVNTNIIDSTGLFLFLSNLGGMLGNIDIRQLGIFGQGNGTDTSVTQGQSNNGSTGCPTGCGAGQTTTIDTTNNAQITNTVVVRSSTGGNDASGDGGDASITTGNAYAAANVINVANTNIIDSNYLMMVVNNFGNYNGDVVLPGQSFFAQLFAHPGGGSSGATTISNTNNASVENNLDVNASTGDNSADGNGGASTIQTGNASAGTNVVNQVNTNIVNNTSIVLLFRIAGNWSGSIRGLPLGLSWRQTPFGISIFNTPGGGGDSNNSGSSGDTTITNTNNASVTNNVQVYALTGENRADSNGGAGMISTGNAFAAANVVNVINTNAIGRNWILAIVNILGDWTGNLAFGRPNLWIGERAELPDGPLAPGSGLTFHMTVKNNGDADATHVNVRDLFDQAHLNRDTSSLNYSLVNNDDSQLSWDIGTVPAGGSTEVTLKASVRGDLPLGQTSIPNEIQVSSLETDENMADNVDTLTLTAQNIPPTENNRGGGSVLGVGYTDAPNLHITKTNNAPKTITASSTVDYKIVITNDGGPSYRSMLVDELENKDGDVIHRGRWNLDQIRPREEITVTYTMVFSATTTPGLYTNYAHIDALGGYPPDQIPFRGFRVTSTEATSSVLVVGPTVDTSSGAGGSGISNASSSSNETSSGNGGASIHDQIANQLQGERIVLSSFIPGITDSGKVKNLVLPTIVPDTHSNLPLLALVAGQVFNPSNLWPLLGLIVLLILLLIRRKHFSGEE